MLVITIIALVLALAATVLAFIFIVPEKKNTKTNAFLKILHDTLNFKYLIIEKILQALYIFATAYIITLGFCMLFYVEIGTNYYIYSTPTKWYGGYGLLVMIVGPILVRLMYEVLMMFVLLIKNVIQINNKLKNENGKDSADIFATPKIPVPKRPAKPATTFCRNCGAKVTENEMFCSNCGARLK